MKICPKCNRQCDDNISFCPECGTPLPQQQYYNAQQQYGNTSNYVMDQGVIRLRSLVLRREAFRCVFYFL